MMGSLFHVRVLLPLFLITASSMVDAQQPYAKKATTNCTKVAENHASLLGYTCNGVQQNCQAYVVYRSLPPYISVSTISTLLSADPSQVSRVNNDVSNDAVFETNQLVIVPISCSCSGNYYQKNTSYVVRQENTPFLIANDTFQGLSTCHAIEAQNSDLSAHIYTGERVNIPLRCACPTKNQTDAGIKYLLSYVVTWGDTIRTICARFGADVNSTFQANSLSEVDFNIYPFTTFLVPLEKQPLANRSTDPYAYPPPLQPPPPPFPQTKHQKNWIYAVAGIGLATMIVAVAFLIFFKKKRRRHTDAVTGTESFEANEKSSNKKLVSESHSHSDEFLQILSSISQSLKMYSYEELQSATDGFSPSCLIRGSVYRGEISGSLAAIKRMDGHGDVSKEINILNRINHFNLIHLSGLCFNEGQCYLVYEYAVNGPLSDWIYKTNSGWKFLNWTQRIQIVMDVATGLSYLHSYTTPPYVHQDIKTSNVLLDSNFRGKITNFNLARSTEGQDGQLVLTKHIVGTKGYMAPEYVEHGLVSTKLDVYAFGIFMLECITGKEVAEFYGERNADLSEIIASSLLKENGTRELVDPALEENYPSELAFVLVKLIERCVKKNPAARPEMNEVVPNLSRILNATFTKEISSKLPKY